MKLDNVLNLESVVGNPQEVGPSRPAQIVLSEAFRRKLSSGVHRTPSTAHKRYLGGCDSVAVAARAKASPRAALQSRILCAARSLSARFGRVLHMVT